MIKAMNFGIKMNLFKKLLLLIILPLNASLAWACVNSYSEKVEIVIDPGFIRDIDSGVIREDQAQAKKELALDSKNQLEEEYKKTPTIEIENDLAVLHLLLGDHQKAIDLLNGIEAKRPGLPKTAANLGTAYELFGNNKDALVWIKEGIKHDPSDHKGTEWLHVKILEAKIAIEKDPQWLKTNSVLGINFGKNELPSKPRNLPVDHLGKVYSLEDTRKAIQTQLEERKKFVAPPDALVGDLFFTWADIDRLELIQNDENGSKDLKGLYALYELALRYGVTNSDIVKNRLSSKDFLIAKAASYLPNVLWITFLILCIAILFVCIRAFKASKR
jgi:tetratricopeptide (TPR) repeat protein